MIKTTQQVVLYHFIRQHTEKRSTIHFWVLIYQLRNTDLLNSLSDQEHFTIPVKIGENKYLMNELIKYLKKKSVLNLENIVEIYVFPSTTSTRQRSYCYVRVHIDTQT